MDKQEFSKLVGALEKALVDEEEGEEEDQGDYSMPGFYYDPTMLRSLTKVDSGVFRRLLGIK
jgi:hypothetical protein